MAAKVHVEDVPEAASAELLSLAGTELKIATEQVNGTNSVIKAAKTCELRRRFIVHLQSGKRDRELRRLHGTFMSADTARYGTGHVSRAEVSFKPGVFLKTFVYELCPPCLNAVVCFTVEMLHGRRAMEAVYACLHRAFIPHLKFQPWPFLLYLLIIFWPLQLLYWYALLVGYFYGDAATRADILVQDFLISAMLTVARACVVATKYSFWDNEELAALYCSAPEWSGDHTNRKLIGQGWSQPLAYPGLLEEECHHATELVGVDLLATSFEVSAEAAAALRKYDQKWDEAAAAKHVFERSSHKHFPASNGLNRPDEVTASCILLHLCKSCHGQPPSTRLQRLGLYAILTMAFIIPCSRMYYGMAGFGSNVSQRLIFASVLIQTFFMGFPMATFCWMTAHDFGRRAKAMEMLLGLVSGQGIPVGELLGHELINFDDTLGTVNMEKMTGVVADDEDIDHEHQEHWEREQEKKKQENRQTEGEAKGEEEEGAVEGKAEGPKSRKTSVLMEAECESRIHLDLKNPNNIFAFLLLRRVLRQVGKAYARRCEAYTLFFMLVGFGAILAINLSLWTKLPHSSATLLQQLVVSVYFVCFLIYISVQATRLQDLVEQQREVLNMEVFSVQKELFEIDTALQLRHHSHSSHQDHGRSSSSTNSHSGGEVQQQQQQQCRQNFKHAAMDDLALARQQAMLTRAEQLLNTAQSSIEHTEVQMEPTTVLGMTASFNLVSSIIATLLTAFFFAWEGYLYSKAHYSPSTGHAIFPTESQPNAVHCMN